MDSFKYFESLSHPCIVVDVQPEYCGIYDGDESSVCQEIIRFVSKQTGPVLMFVNAEQTDVSRDTLYDIKLYWEESGFDPENWDRIEIVDKGYGHFRPWMDLGIPPALIIKTIRLMYQQKVNDSRQLFGGEDSDTYEDGFKQFANTSNPRTLRILMDEPLLINWTSVAQLKRFSGAYLVGGGRSECLREVELLMNAFNIKYKRIDSLVYGE